MEIGSNGPNVSGVGIISGSPYTTDDEAKINCLTLDHVMIFFYTLNL